MMDKCFDISACDCLIDLHLHLDGSLSLESVKELARLEGVELDLNDGEILSRLTVSDDCRDLNEYLEKFDFPLTLLQSSKTIERAFYNLGCELKTSGLMYAEIRFAPQLHKKKGLSGDMIVRAALRGLKASGLPSNIIICMMRGENNREENLESVRLAKKYLGGGVCALDLAGAEGLYKNELFCEEISLARSLGIPVTLHAGEASGHESVMSALSMGACRIGHGVRSYKSDETMALLREKGTLLELCPTSNLNTSVFERLGDYPIRTFMEHGVRISVNTDNMSVSATDIKKEWQRLINTFSLKDAEIHKILSDTLSGSFASDEDKRRMQEKIDLCFQV